MKILVCNAGSTSLKFKFYEMPECKLYAQGHVERVGSADDAVFHYRNVISVGSADLEKQCIPGYREGIEMFLYLSDRRADRCDQRREGNRAGRV